MYDKITHKQMLYNECFENCDVIIIDEISMIDGKKKLDKIIKRVRYVNKHNITNKHITKLFFVVIVCNHLLLVHQQAIFLIVVNLKNWKNIQSYVN